MKIRNGFVSNSSSSSFVLASKDQKDFEKEVELKIKFKLSSCVSEIITSVEDLKQIMLEEYCYDEDFEEYVKAKKAIEEGKVVVVGSFSNDSCEPVEQMLYEYGLEAVKIPKSVEIISEEN